MTTNTELTKAAIDKLVAEFDKKFATPVANDIESNNAAIVDLQDNSADRTYDLLAALMDLADTLDVDGPVLDGFKQFLIDRSLAPARGTNNPYLPFIKAVFSVKVDGKWTYLNLSASKYANVLRHLTAVKRKGSLNGSIQDYIRSYSDPLYGKKMKGIEAQDRADNPSKGAADRNEAIRKTGRNAKALVTVPNTFGILGRKVVLLYGQTNINGEVEVLKAEALDDAKADSFYYTLGRELTPAK